MRRFDQLLAGYTDGDAISRDARGFRGVLRSLGFASDIVVPARGIGRGVAEDCVPMEEFRPSSGDGLLYHYSIGSPATRMFLQAGTRKVVRYHNITPGHFFEGFDDALAAELRDGRASLGEVARQADAVWAVSQFNANEVRSLGVAEVHVVAPLTPVAPPAGEMDADIANKLGGGLTNLLFVGRIVPNKVLEELILMFAAYHGGINPGSRLVLVGSERSCPRYFAMVRLLAARLGLTNVCFEGFLSDARLDTCYRMAHVFVTASRHEGFCVPLLEAMAAGLPVVARAAGGMPEAMGNAGVLFDEIEPAVLAELVDLAARNGPFRGEVLGSQAVRVKALARRDTMAECRGLIERLG